MRTSSIFVIFCLSIGIIIPSFALPSTGDKDSDHKKEVILVTPTNRPPWQDNIPRGYLQTTRRPQEVATTRSRGTKM
ncbi:hypothetical protein F5148DRAFT_1175396, partial [Russula earlei]